MKLLNQHVSISFLNPSYPCPFIFLGYSILLLPGKIGRCLVAAFSNQILKGKR